MIHVPPLPFLRRRAIKPPAAMVAGPLTLVSATYDPAALVIVLTFDRAIDVSGLDVYSITVADGPLNHGQYWAAGTPLMLGPAAVRLELSEDGHSDAPDTTLTAAATNGIVAQSDGAAWPGVSGFALTIV